MKFIQSNSLVSVCLILLIPACYTTTTIDKLSVDNEDLKLELVQVLFRHGARTPVKWAIPDDNFTSASLYEPFGVGQLLPKGKQQEYQFGQFLRTRYNDYLGPYYKSEDVYAYAGIKDRTQMSLQLVLAGLYPPEGVASVWNSELKWSPIPYVTVPKELDILLESFDMPRFTKTLKKVQHSKEFKNKSAKFSELFKFVKDKITMKYKNIISNILAALDILAANEYMDKPLPDWYTPEVKLQFLDLKKFSIDAYVSTLKLKKMGIGPLIKTFIQNMNLNGTLNNPRKIYLYGGHDINILMFTSVHDVRDIQGVFKYALFGSAVIIEKLRDKRNQVYVRLLGWDGAGELTTLKIGSHGELCPIEDYLKIVKDVIPSDQEIDAMLGELTTEKIKKILFGDDKVTQVEK